MLILVRGQDRNVNTKPSVRSWNDLGTVSVVALKARHEGRTMAPGIEGEPRRRLSARKTASRTGIVAIFTRRRVVTTRRNGNARLSRD
jgi:hypothetical protein